MASSVTYATLETANVEQLAAKFTELFPERRVPKRKAALLEALRRHFGEGDEESKSEAKETKEKTEPKEQRGNEAEDLLSALSFAELKALAAKHSIKGRSKEQLREALKAAGITGGEAQGEKREREEEEEEKQEKQEEEAKEEKPKRGRKKKEEQPQPAAVVEPEEEKKAPAKRGRKKKEEKEEAAVAVEKKAPAKRGRKKKAEEQPAEEEEEEKEEQHDDVVVEKKKKAPAKRGRKKKADDDDDDDEFVLEEEDSPTGKKKKKKKEEEEEDEEIVDGEEDDEEEQAGDAAENEADWKLNELKAVAKKHKVTNLRSKKAIIEALRGLKVNIGAEINAGRERGAVPFDSVALLTATISELKEFGKAVGAKSKRKEDLLRELKHMLPENDQWASSDEAHASRTIPGTNGYGNVDVRDGIPDGCKHVNVLRAGPTCRANRIPFSPAMIGFNSWRGRYSPEISGIVIFKQDWIKLRGLLAAKEKKKERAAERLEVRLNTPKVPQPWTFADLPPQQQQLLRDFSTLPRDCWIAIFKHCDALDVLVCARVCKGLQRLSLSNDVWQAKLFADFSVCAEHAARSQNEARGLYLDLASSLNCQTCQMRREGVKFVDVYKNRARDWLLHSTKGSREQAIREACNKLNYSIHPTSKLYPAFLNGTAGDDKGPMEVAAIMKGVGVLFSYGGHGAFEALHTTLHSELFFIKFRDRCTWDEALDKWTTKYRGSMQGYQQERYYHYGGYGRRSRWNSDYSDDYDDYDRYDRYW